MLINGNGHFPDTFTLNDISLLSSSLASLKRDVSAEELARELQNAFYAKKENLEHEKPSKKQLQNEDIEQGFAFGELSDKATDIVRGQFQEFPNGQPRNSFLRILENFKGLNKEKPTDGIDPFVATLVLEACMQLKGIKTVEEAKALAEEFGLDMQAFNNLVNKTVKEIETQAIAKLNDIMEKNREAAKQLNIGVEPADL